MPSYLSYSQLALYLECPLRYKLRYLSEGGYGDEKPPAALVFGTAMHQALAWYYTAARNGESFNLTEFLDVFAAAWETETDRQGVVFGVGEDSASLLGLGQTMLRTYARLARPMRVVAVEAPFEFRLEHPRTGRELAVPIRGVIDLIEEDENGALWVVDHKTAARPYTEQQMAGDLQMLIYAAAVRQMDEAKGREVLLRLDVLTKSRKPQLLQHVMRRTDEDVVRLYEIVDGVWRAIEAEAFYPRCCISARWGMVHEECRAAHTG